MANVADRYIYIISVVIYITCRVYDHVIVQNMQIFKDLNDSFRELGVSTAAGLGFGRGTVRSVV